MLILDNFIYNGEPIVYFRLKYLYDYVDKFIIVENIYTHSGAKKDDYFYNKNKDKFKEFEDKIIFIPMDQYLPTGEHYNKIVKIIDTIRYYEATDAWITEMYQREYIQIKIKEILNNINKNNEPYIIFVCDSDEIPRRGLYNHIKNDYEKLDNGIHLEMIYLMYGFNYRKKNLWFHPFVINDRGTNQHHFSLVRLVNHNICYKNVGWHISYYLSIKEFKRKLQSFTHQEVNIDDYNKEEHLKNCIKNGIHFHDTSQELIKTTEDELPENYKEINKEMIKLYDMNEYEN